MRLAIVYCLHGDEKRTEDIAKYFVDDSRVKIFLGNPRAYKENVRYTESDLNRSFNMGDTYESRRAQELKKELEEYNPDFILDIHTTRAKMDPSIIITGLKQLELAKRLGEKKVLYMTDKFAKGGSLIENMGNAICVELFDSPEVINIGIQMVNNILKEEVINSEFELYIVERVVKDRPDFPVINFEKLSNGKYPVFYGENTSYRKNLGVYYLECSMEERSL